MKLLGLDTGDVWVGIAISDALGISCKPLKTVHIDDLETSLTLLFAEEEIDTVVIGYPKTLRGTMSEQTKKVVTLKNNLEQKSSQLCVTPLSWVLWDERLSSKRARALVHNKKKEISARKTVGARSCRCFYFAKLSGQQSIHLGFNVTTSYSSIFHTLSKKPSKTDLSQKLKTRTALNSAILDQYNQFFYNPLKWFILKG